MPHRSLVAIASLTIALQRAQEDPLYRELRLPWLKPTAGVSDDVLEHIVTLFETLKQQSQAQPATPEAARRANVELRAEMRARDFVQLVNDRPTRQGARTVRYHALTGGDWADIHYRNRTEAKADPSKCRPRRSE